jgi:hypothetical protein
MLIMIKKLILNVDNAALKRLNQYSSIAGLVGNNSKGDILLNMICEALNDNKKELVIRPNKG